MPQTDDPYSPWPLTDKVRGRQNLFMNQQNKSCLLGIAGGDGDVERARRRLGEHETNVFAIPYALAGIYDLRFVAVIRALERQGKRSPENAARIRAEVIEAGIDAIKLATQKGGNPHNAFDLREGDDKALRKFKNGLRWHKLGEFRDRQRHEDRFVSLNAPVAGSHDETTEYVDLLADDAVAAPDCDRESALSIVEKQAKADLPAVLRAVLPLMGEQQTDENHQPVLLDGMQRRHKAACKVTLGLFISVNLAAQTKDGRVHIELAAWFLKHDWRRQVVIRRYTGCIGGVEPPDGEAFEGTPLKELVHLRGPGSRLTGEELEEAVRWDLANDLAEIAALFDPARRWTWKALPAADVGVLAQGINEARARRLPSAAARTVLAKLTAVYELRERTMNPKRHNKPWLDPSLSEAQKKLLKDSYDDGLEFEEIAQSLNEDVDAVKIDFLKAVCVVCPIKKIVDASDGGSEQQPVT
ncbi:MAG: hypothetical protein K1X78_22140 [Verrucomicrobiaceae bacterium]|nr:hypothetical protein [Verrucomicrobiaceae bacterium]